MEEFEKRLRGYASGKQHYAGRSTRTNIDRWSARASANSLHPDKDGEKYRAKGEDTEHIRHKDADVPTISLETSEGRMVPKPDRDFGDKVIAEAKRDPNHYGSDYYKSIRRKA